MGDMADMIIADGMDSYWGDHEDDEEHEPPEGPPSHSCRYCGFSPLWWANGVGGGNAWRLIDADRKTHACKEYERRKFNEQRSTI